MNRIVERQRMRCRADDGSEHIIIEYQEMIDATTIKGRQFVPGIKSLRDSHGRPCNFIEDGVFEIVQTGQIVRKI